MSQSISSSVSDQERRMQVIMLEPLYDSYAAMARRAGGKIVPVSLQPPDWSIPRDKLEAAFSPQTKAILVNSPHNPTGTAFSSSDLEAIAALCKQHDVIAICDEVYEHLIYEGVYQAAPAQACATSQRLLTTALGFPGRLLDEHAICLPFWSLVLCVLRWLACEGGMPVSVGPVEDILGLRQQSMSFNAAITMRMQNLLEPAAQSCAGWSELQDAVRSMASADLLQAI